MKISYLLVFFAFLFANRMLPARLLLLILILIGGPTANCFSQSPDKISYQAVARNASGNPIVNTNIGVKFIIWKTSVGGPKMYEETHGVTTNAFGLFNLVIGNGTPVSGNMSTIAWGTGIYLLEVFIDPAPPGTFTSMGATQFVSVPYALHAATADSITGGSASPWLSGAGVVYPTVLTHSVGIGTSAPASILHLKHTSAMEQIIENTGGNFKTGLTIKTAFKEWFIGQENLGVDGFRIADLTAGKTRLQILPTGEMGIGTNSPGQTLTVDGDFGILEGGLSPSFHTVFKGGDQTDDIFYTLPTDQATATSVLQNNGSGVLSWQPAAAADNLGDHTATQNIILGNNWLSGDGTNQGIRIDAAGNVGIGNIPGVKLDVYGGDIRATNTSSSAIYAYASDPSSTSYFSLVAHNAVSSPKEWRIINDGTSANLTFWNGADRVKIDASGQLGIGVVPAAMLDVAGTTKLGTSGNSFSGMLSGSVSVDPPSINATSTGTVNVTIANVSAGDRVFLTPPATISGAIVPIGASAIAGGVNIFVRNITGANVDDPPANWSYLIIKP